MKIITLVENESEEKKLKAVHGLSLYIETKNHKVLFDVGPNNYFIKNAKKLGISLEDVDTVIISHGHFDHGNGLNAFLKLNSQATVYISEHATKEHVKRNGKDHLNIGIKRPKDQERLLYINKDNIVDDELQIISSVPYQDQIIVDPELMTYQNGRYVQDTFNHEIYLVVKEDEKIALFSGCSHKGIENIIDSIEKQYDITFTHVFGGYHFAHYDSFNFKETDYLTHLGQKFNKRSDSTFYSCHCTGNDAFYQLKIHLRNKLHRIKTGDEIII